jgi:ATP-dependent DNA helicase RecG
MLDQPITTLKGFGTRKAQKLKKLGIETVEDLLLQYPYRYVDRRALKRISEISDEAPAVIEATVVQKQIRPKVKGRNSMMILRVSQDYYSGEILFFNPHYIQDRFETGKAYWFFGKIERHGAHFKMIQPEFTNKGDAHFLCLMPVYPLTEGIRNKELVDAKRYCLEVLEQTPLAETLPNAVVNMAKLYGRFEAMRGIHFPKDADDYRASKRRIVYEELFLLQLRLLLIRRNLHRISTRRYEVPDVFDRWLTTLPFQLTEAQSRALDEIKGDLESGRAMNRLLQGDVGSGKTVIAFAAMYLAVLNGDQAAMLAPTTLLAEQHYNSFVERFGDSVPVALLTSGLSALEKRRVKEDIENGTARIVIGTHALFQEDVAFESLGLVVTDEQHRFGIRQRLSALHKGSQPHALIMSATPIPRTLSLILYGDMDTSTIDVLPKGRIPIKTHFVAKDKVESMYDFIEERLKEGRQAYVVCPLIEASEETDMVAATAHYEALVKRYPGRAVGLVHGRMKASEKESVMRAFKENDVQVLVSTTVIEVGINVPNATVMVILNAERFGLAQLHQLRGRVGRGAEASYCFLLSEKLSKTAKQRIETMVNTSSGFEIAEKDLELRGPGELFGTRQHGLPELRMANLSRDKKALIEVQEHVKIVMSEYDMKNLQMVRFVEGVYSDLEKWFAL